MTEIVMPRLSDSMEQGTILTWLKEDGDEIAVGDELVEIETDKATMTYQAEVGGVLRIIAAAGETRAVGVPIAQVDDAAADGPQSARSPAMTVASADTTSIGSVAATSDSRAAADAGNGHVWGSEPDRRAPDTAISLPPERRDRLALGPAAVRATPLARRVARVHGVALEQIVGSGPGGRVTRADVLVGAGLAPTPTQSPPPPEDPRPVRSRVAPTAAATAGEPGSSKGTITTVELSRLQTVIARRMAEAKATIPHFQVQTDVVMDDAIALRTQMKAVTEAGPSLNDLVVKAAALALRTHPLANGSYRDGHFELHSRINVGIAVASQDALVVPTIFDADQKSLGAIAADARRLAQSVRDGTVTPPNLAGATFTVSNLGMHGMTAINPVINQPQAAILGVGSLRHQLARVDGEIVEQQLMALTLSCDHRILYGANAAQFLSEIRANLEQPLRLAL
jgi:pyruvate dehydrogenase E2 component (dihydrolipoamide acetyltransferase)